MRSEAPTNNCANIGVTNCQTNTPVSCRYFEAPSDAAEPAGARCPNGAKKRQLAKIRVLRVGGRHTDSAPPNLVEENTSEVPRIKRDRPPSLVRSLPRYRAELRGFARAWLDTQI